MERPAWFCKRCGTIKTSAFCTYRGDSPGCPGCPMTSMERIEYAEAVERSAKITPPLYAKPQHDA